MLMPALKNAIESGRRAVCLSNEKQYGIGFALFDGDFSKLPDYKHANTYLSSLAGSPLDNSADANCAVSENYTTHQDRALFLRDYVGIRIVAMSRPQHSYIPNWQKDGLQMCPSASHNEEADKTDPASPYNPSSDFGVWGALRIFYKTAGMNILWQTGAMNSGGSDRYVPKRKITAMNYPDQTIAVYEHNIVDGVNNHKGEGMNVLTMDGAARWVSTDDCYYTGTYNDRWTRDHSGDGDVGKPVFMPSEYAAVSEMFPNINTYVPANLNGGTSFLATHLGVVNLDKHLRDLGFQIAQW